MKGLSITDKSRGFLTFDLIDILKLLGPAGRESEWKISGVESTGEAADELESLAEKGGVVKGSKLFDLASRIVQVIDGEFVATKDGGGRPWIVVRGVDSSTFDVFTDDVGIRAAIRERFREVAELDFEET